ncbi:MAG: hypothetical protein L0338_11685 [Acidobacteria bacterium]|nr:hypothetical protein [Acidobacteriota bacterium]
MTSFKPMTVALVLGLVGALLYVVATREPRLQARVRVDVRSEGTPVDWEPWKTCPNLAFTASDEADYTLWATWVDTGWTAILDRSDGTGRWLEKSPDSSKVLREACRTVEADFPAWLSTERQRLSTGRVGVDRSAAVSASTAHRYDLREYRHGSVVGLAMIDTELGRAWALTDIVDERGRKVRMRFEEVGVAGLWETEDEIWSDVEKAKSDEMRRFYMRRWDEFRKVRELTRPKLIQDAEAKASRESLSAWSASTP